MNIDLPAVPHHDERTIRMMRQHPATPSSSRRRRGPLGVLVSFSGSGAFSSRVPVLRVMALVTVLAAAALTLMVGSALAAPKGVVNMFGATGAGKGQFSNPRGVAVRQSTGDVYVVDSTNNRIEQFDSAGSFIRAWGQDVDSTTAGTGFEICPSTDTCQKGLATATTANGGDMNAPQGIAIDQSDGSVYVTDQGNRRVQKFTSAGAFVAAFGWDVTIGGVTTFEVCAVPANCKTGVASSGDGQFGTSIGYPAVDPVSGDVYVADSANKRVQRFNSSGNFVSKFGSFGTGSGQFGSSSPNRVAVDSAGFVYTIDNGNSRVQRFSPSGTSGLVFGGATLSGSPAPNDIVVNLANGNVFVAKSTTVSPIERQVQELDFGGTLVATHAVGAGLPSTNGIAVNEGSGQIYLSTSTNNRLFALGIVTPPTATITPVSPISSTGATLNGAVNPTNGFQTGYHFEYSTDGVSWTKAPAIDVDVGTGNTDTPVSQAITGLTPNKLYHVRLVASRPFGGGSATSTETTFTTNTAPPSVSNTYSSVIRYPDVHVGGYVNPQNSATTYHFEYGTDTTYGTNMPATDGQVGSGTSKVLVHRVITGLTPGTTYHFRLVATNIAGETDGPDATFTTRTTAPVAAEHRAYELVTPADKLGYGFGYLPRAVLGGYSSGLYGLPPHPSEDGGHFAYSTNSSLVGAPNGVNGQSYMATRTATGWVNKSMTPPLPDSFEGIPFQGAQHLAYYGSDPMTLSEDLSTWVFTAFIPYSPLDQDPFLTRDIYVRGSDGSLAFVNPPGVAKTSDVLREFAGVSADGKHVIFKTDEKLVTPLENGRSNGQGLYDFTGGQIIPVGLASDGTLLNPCGADAPNMSFGQLAPGHPMSSDGSKIFFVSPQVTGPGCPATRQLYVRLNHQTTIQFSASRRTTPDPAGTQTPTYLSATPDGSKVFFTSSEMLTDDATAGGGVYEYDTPTAGSPTGQLRFLSEWGSLGNFRLQDLRDRSPLATTDNGSAVVFKSDDQLVPGKGTQGVGAGNLYLWNGSSVQYMGSAGTVSVALSPDGSKAVFATPSNVTGYISGGADEVYLYDATTDTGPVCVSCDPSEPPLGRSVLGFNSVDDDGTVFFDSPARLVEGDVNSNYDVYQYRDGSLALISSGTSSYSSFLVGAGTTGRDVFFATNDSLVPTDRDGDQDFYDARIGGGFPVDQPAQECDGDLCQGSQTQPPALSSSTTGVNGATGNVADGPPSSDRRVIKVVRPKTVRGFSFTVRVSVPAKGRITASGVYVTRVTRSVGKAGTYTLRLRLTAKAKRALRRKGEFRSPVVLTYTPTAGRASANRIVVTIKPAKGGRR